MARWRRFTYRDYFDQPRALYVAEGAGGWLLSCPFDEALDDYPARYQVYELPALAPAVLAGSWEGLERHALRQLAPRPVPLSALDPTRRLEIDLDALKLPDLSAGS